MDIREAIDLIYAEAMTAARAWGQEFEVKIIAQPNGYVRGDIFDNGEKVAETQAYWVTS